MSKAPGSFKNIVVKFKNINVKNQLFQMNKVVSLPYANALIFRLGDFPLFTKVVNLISNHLAHKLRQRINS